ncbi:MAG: 50S ribosomal protein L10 [Planctomycetota bacterium]|nr:50S ribosomal protein L10 [Planctomycetota bacterium]
MSEQEKLGAEEPSRIKMLLKGEVSKRYESLSNIVMVRNNGLNSEETTEARSELRAKGLGMKVVRNRISIQAFRAMGVADAEKLFNGPTAIIEAEDPVMAAKVAVDFVKKFNGKLEIVAGLLDGKVLDAKAVKSLAASKSKPELLAEISGMAKGPGSKVSAQIKGMGGKLASQLKSLVEKLEKDGAAA